MRVYRIGTVASEASVDWSRVAKAPVDIYKWLDNGYEPETYAQIVFVKDYGFIVKMTCAERNPRATMLHTDDFVCFDSCMEFFAQFADGDDRYVNIEVNPLGTTLSFLGPDRYERTSVVELTGSTWDVTAEKTEDTWSVTAKVPLEKLCRLYGIEPSRFRSGYRFRGNFYKCGDSCEIRHYGMWNPVDLDTPDFHRPEFFGELEIE